ncbi:MAG: hypothetical protein Q4C34_00340 [Bacteroidales bacterium]|nr:hypothetical protein [Bacteroidales bacterium]
MQLTRFNLPVEIIDLISTLEPENQGIVYSHLFAYIYHGVEIGDDVDPRCRLILKLIIDKIDTRVKRARQAQQRRQEKAVTAAQGHETTCVSGSKGKGKSEPQRSAVAARIMQNGRAVHDRISPLGQALYEAQLRAESAGPGRHRTGAAQKRRSSVVKTPPVLS